jgi:hypothetical protein
LNAAFVRLALAQVNAQPRPIAFLLRLLAALLVAALLATALRCVLIVSPLLTILVLR